MKRVGFLFWVAVLLLLLAHASQLSPTGVAAVLDGAGSWKWALYLGVLVLRSLWLVPSTPMVLAGALLFPGHPLLVIFLSVTGVLLGATLIFFLADLLGTGAALRRRYPDKVEPAEVALRKRGFLVVLLGAFCPLVPTDLLSYLAGTVRMAYSTFAAAVVVGELPLITICVYSGRGLFEWLLS